MPRLRVAYVSLGSAPEQIPDVVLRRNPESGRDWGFHTFVAAPWQHPLGRGTWLTGAPGRSSLWPAPVLEGREPTGCLVHIPVPTAGERGGSQPGSNRQ